MGGHLIDNARRMPLEDHNRLRDEVLRALERVFPGLPMGGTEALRDKKDFGDIDIVVGIDQLGEWPIEALKSFFETHGIQQTSLNAKVAYENDDPLHGRVILKQNRGVFSFGWPYEEGFAQVDFILTPNAFFQVTQDYFSWGGVGNLIGRSASKMGFQLGTEGLQYFFSHPALRGSRNILITEHLDEALDFLGYNPKRYQQGFNHAKDAFSYVLTSPWFDPTLYLPQNRPHDARVRDAKHPLHVAFLTWMAEQGILKQPALVWPESAFFLEEAKRRWPAFSERMKRVEEEVQSILASKPPFDGHWIQEHLGIKGVELGEFLKKAKEAWSENEVFRQTWHDGNEEEKVALLQTLQKKQKSDFKFSL